MTNTQQTPLVHAATLEEQEDTATLDCGCVLTHVDEGDYDNPGLLVQLYWCPVHDAAQDLLAACEAIERDWEHNLTDAIRLVRAAIEKARS